MTDADDAIRDQATSHIESLLSELYEPEGVQIWMTSPHRFGGRRAVDLMPKAEPKKYSLLLTALMMARGPDVGRTFGAPTRLAGRSAAGEHLSKPDG